MEQLNNFPFKDWLQTLDQLEETMRVASLDKDGRERYERSLKQYRDLNAFLSYHKDLEEKKLEDGIAIGEERGEARERAKALKEKLENARRLIAEEGWTLEKAASFFGLTPEAIALN